MPYQMTQINRLRLIAALILLCTACFATASAAELKQ